jgi:hypothetical protein
MGRLLNGSSSRINIGSADRAGLLFTHGTTAICCTRVDQGTFEDWWSNNAGADGSAGFSDLDKLFYFVPGFTRVGTTSVATGVPLVCAITKTTGTTTPRGHIYRFDTNVWVHENLSGTAGNLAAMSSLDMYSFGNAASELLEGEQWALGLWQNQVMTDSAVERLARGRWLETNPTFYAQWTDGRELSMARTHGRNGARATTETAPLIGTVKPPPGFRFGPVTRRR